MTTGTGNSGAVIEYTLGCPFGLVICESDAETATVTSAQVEIAKNVITQNASTIFKRFDWLRRNENNTNLNSHNIKLNIDISNPVLISLKNNLQNSLNNNLLILTSTARDIAHLDKSKINELLQKAEANLNTQSTDKERYVASYKLETLKEISQ